MLNRLRKHNVKRCKNMLSLTISILMLCSIFSSQITSVFAAPKHIDRIDVTGFVKPRAGDTPTFQATITQPAGLEIVTEEFTDWDTDESKFSNPTLPGTLNKFIQGNTYMYTIYIKNTQPSTQYFDNDTDIWINGKNWGGYVSEYAYIYSILDGTIQGSEVYEMSDTHTMTFDPNGGEGSMADAIVPDEGDYTLPPCTFTPPAGREFDKWERWTVYYKVGDTIKNVTNSYDFNAIWKLSAPKTFKVTFDANGGTGTMADDTATEEENYKLPKCGFTPPSGYKFDFWEVNGDTPFYPGKNYPVKRDLNVKARWKSVSHTLKFSPNGGTGNMPDVTVNDGDNYILPDCGFTAPSGQIFDQWDVGGTKYNVGDTIRNITANRTIKAIWKPASLTTYTLTFDSNGGVGSMLPQSVNHGDAYVLPSCSFTAPSGNIFDQWEVEGRKYDVGDTISGVITHLSIKALWRSKTHIITFNGNGGTGTMANVTISDGGKYILPECNFVAPSGKAFNGWIVDGMYYSVGKEILDITTDLNIIPEWVALTTAKIIFDSNGGAGTMPSFTVSYGANYTLPPCTFIPPSGQQFDKWKVEGTSYKEGDTVLSITTNLTIKAIWKIPVTNATIYFDGNGGKVMPSFITKTTAFILNATDIPMPTRTGYDFIQWNTKADASGMKVEEGHPVNVGTSETVYAIWKTKASGGSSGGGGGSSTSNYAIEKEKIENGSIKVDSEAKEGETVTVTVEPDKGYELDKLSVTDKKGNEIKLTKKNDNQYTFLMPSKKVMVGATFKKTEPNIVPIINPNNNTKDKQPTIETRTTIFTIGSNLMKQNIKSKDKASEGHRQMDAKPFISKGRTTIPLRYSAECFGMKVEWSQKMQTVTLKDHDSIVRIPINSNKIIVTETNGETKEYTSDVKPIVKEGRTYLTISNIGKTIGAEMTWNNTAKQITVTKQVMVEE